MEVKICIILLNICILINCLHIRYVYKTLNNKLLKQIEELEKQFNVKFSDIECKHQKDMLDFINEIEYVLTNKVVKTKKKK